MKITNINNIPLSLGVFLVTDNYDYSQEEKTISATSLMKSTRQVILGTRHTQEGLTTDLSNYINSALGSAIHDTIERSWKENYQQALEILGYPSSVINSIKINPTELKEGDIPIRLEERVSKEFNGWKITGKYDFILDGQLEDFKTTSTYKYTKGTSDQEYIQQGSIYRWIKPEYITKDTIQINWIFTDWSALRAKTTADYPKSRIVSKHFQLWSEKQTEYWIAGRLKAIEEASQVSDEDLPWCSDEELWREPDVYKYYASGKITSRSTKNFTNKRDADLYFAEVGRKGLMLPVKGKVKACNYCPVFNFCNQKDYLIQNGDLEIK